jgi:hypothetical protein
MKLQMVVAVVVPMVVVEVEVARVLQMVLLPKEVVH